LDRASAGYVVTLFKVLECDLKVPLALKDSLSPFFGFGCLSESVKCLKCFSEG
jgi:hypothetical protein